MRTGYRTDVSGIPETSDVKYPGGYNQEQMPRIIQDVHFINIDYSTCVNNYST